MLLINDHMDSICIKHVSNVLDMSASNGNPERNIPLVRNVCQ